MKIKICGLRRQQDIEAVNSCKPDYAGFILSGGFKRSIDKDTFYALSGSLDKSIKSVGVFVDEPLESIVSKGYNTALDVIQLHGSESEEYIASLRAVFNGEIWKAVRAKSVSDIENTDSLSADMLLIDSFVKGKAGGTGVAADTEIIKKASITKPYFMAGGISESNAAGICKELSPIGLDISSSVETDGFKDDEKIRRIITLIREEL